MEAANWIPAGARKRIAAGRTDRTAAGMGPRWDAVLALYERQRLAVPQDTATHTMSVMMGTLVHARPAIASDTRTTLMGIYSSSEKAKGVFDRSPVATSVAARVALRTERRSKTAR